MKIRDNTLDIIGKLFKIEETNSDSYCFAFELHEQLIKQSKDNETFSSGGNLLNCKHISYLSCWLDYENIHGEQSFHDIMKLLKQNHAKIELLRGNPVISYLANIDYLHRDKIDISKDDINYLNEMIADIGENSKEIDLIIYSLGGCIIAARKIVEFLYKRFEKVNYIIISDACSAAAMMCMSANEIIMTPFSSMGPYDVQIQSPDTGNYLPVDVMLKCAKEAKQSFNPFNLLITRNSYKNWTKEMCHNTIKECAIGSYETVSYPTYWLMKYTFKSYITNNEGFDRYVLTPLWSYFTKNGRKAKRIVNFFIKTGVKFGHSAPIFHSDLEHSGLNISLADGELLDLLSENKILSEVAFTRSNTYKLYVSKEKYLYRYMENNHKLFITP